MNKIYILTIVDLDGYGYNPKDVEVFPTEEMATERMRELYLKDCKKWGIENPYDDDSDGLMHQFCEGAYAYIFGEHYYDIFEKEIGIVA